MKMRNSVEQSIQNALNEGFTLTEEGIGNYETRESYWRSQNKMVVSWYVGSTEDGQKKFQLYTREKKSRGTKRVGSVTKVQTPDYSIMTVKELREIGKTHGIKNISKLSKSDLIQKIKEVA